MRHAFALLLLILPLAGCLNRSSSLGKGPVQPNPEPLLARDATVRANQLSTMIDQLDAAAKQLPTAGNDPALRTAMADVFANLSQILPTLYGPNESGAFRQQRRIIDSTRTQLQNMADNLSPDPVVGAGLRATYNALSNLQRDQFFDKKEIATSLDDYRGHLDQLDAAQGPAMRPAIAQSVQSLSKTLRQMSDTLAERLAQNPNPAQPAATAGDGAPADRQRPGQQDPAPAPTVEEKRRT